MRSLDDFTDSELQKEFIKRLQCGDPVTQKQVILLGPPGAGKGTAANKIKNKFCVCQLSTGDMLREEISQKSPIGLEVQETIKNGQLVSDNIVINLIKNNMNKYGALLDGFPRNINQAKEFDKMLQKEGKKIDHVLYLDVSDDIVTERLSGRLTHLASGRTYHEKFKAPRVAGKDDVTGEPLIVRPDDTLEAIQKRINIYHDQTDPLVAFYTQKNILTRFDAASKPKQIWTDIKHLLKRGS